MPEGGDESSSINTDQVEQFAEKMESKVEEGVKVPTPNKTNKFDP